MTYVFLSDEWLDAVASLVGEYASEVPEGTDLVLNVEVVDTPFDSDRRLHVGARNGEPQWGADFDPTADVTISCDYQTASDIFLSGDPQAGLTAFVTGKVRIQGDVSKLMAGGGMSGIPLAAPEIAAKVTAITEVPGSTESA
jgi:hypothetical protein